ncbi:hypothetical protein Glove_152g66 [Diversispora epigaea]|uniref:Uncharacterized protein n=1 Tax=Diversispora epigaea TaxID=1348612 RepID=A0A397J176_9GLOM|nr:hypothetical protein Glove_152g66 [Diversispora epigaea]
MNNNNNLNNNMNSSNSNNKLTSRQRNIRPTRTAARTVTTRIAATVTTNTATTKFSACNKASLQEKSYYEKYLWKSQSLEPTDKISTRPQNQLHLYYLLAGVLIRECTRNYSLELIISNIIIRNDINLNIKTWDYFRLWYNMQINYHFQKDHLEKFYNFLKMKWDILLEDGSFEIDNKLHIKSSDMIDLAQGKYRSTRLESFTYPKSAHCLVNPGCIVNQNNQTLIHLENIDDTNILLHTTNAVNTYYYHMVNDEKHRSKSFWRDLTEHYGAYRLYTGLPYTSSDSASSHNTDHQSCVDELIRSLVPLSNFVNKFIQDNYNSMYLKLKNLSLGPFAPRSFGIFPMIAINYNIVSNYHWDLSDASNCLCCLIPLGNFQGGDLYFPQLHVRVPLQPGQVVAFDSHNLLHGNLPLISGIRHSIIYFVHQNFFHKEDNYSNMEIENIKLTKSLHDNKNLNKRILLNYTINVPKNKDQRHSPEELERGRKRETEEPRSTRIYCANIPFEVGKERRELTAFYYQNSTSPITLTQPKGFKKIYWSLRRPGNTTSNEDFTDSNWHPTSLKTNIFT